MKSVTFSSKFIQGEIPFGKTEGETSHCRHDPWPLADFSDSLYSKIQANGAVHSSLTIQACAFHINKFKSLSKRLNFSLSLQNIESCSVLFIIAE